MHLGNGAITAECAVLTASLAAAGLGFAAASLRRGPMPKDRWLLAGVSGAAVFAAQMVNFPVLPYASGHLVGGVLLAVLLGPGLGAVTMAIVLALQALLLGDGGYAALGANVLNMALLPAAIVATCRSTRASLAGVQAALATLLAAVLVVLEVAVARSVHEAPLTSFAWQMIASHAVIAMLEGALTFGVVGLLARLASPAKQSAVLAVAAAALLALTPWASQLPDGYEASAERSEWLRLLTETPQQLAAPNATLAAWQAALVEQTNAVLPSELALALVATLLAGMLSAGIAWLSSSRATVANAS